MKRFFRQRALAVGAAAFLPVACVDLPTEHAPRSAGTGRITADRLPGLEPSAGGLSRKEVESLHFRVRAYGTKRAESVRDLAEQLYERIMADSGLYSFMPRELYPIVVYATKEEYRRKSGMPEWSGGLAKENTIYTFDSPEMVGVLAHEMTHLIFYEYMGSSDGMSRWINEGLAVYEEQKALNERGLALPMAPRRTIPFRDMIALAPLEERGEKAVEWYGQAASVVRFMIERGGNAGFGMFLRTLRSGRSLDEAVARGFPRLWKDLDAVERTWGSTW